MKRERFFFSFSAVTVTEPHLPRARSKWPCVCGIAVCCPGLVIMVPELLDHLDANCCQFCSLPGLIPASWCPSHPPQLLHLPWLFSYLFFLLSAPPSLPPDLLVNILIQSSLTWQQAGSCSCSDCPTAWRGNEGSRRDALLPACDAFHRPCHSPRFSN